MLTYVFTSCIMFFFYTVDHSNFVLTARLGYVGQWSHHREGRYIERIEFHRNCLVPRTSRNCLTVIMPSKRHLIVLLCYLTRLKKSDVRDTSYLLEALFSNVEIALAWNIKRYSSSVGTSQHLQTPTRLVTSDSRPGLVSTLYSSP